MHELLEKYLLQIERQLSALPVEQRVDELREIQSHLEMMIDKNVACSDNLDKAVAKALKQFGSVTKIGRSLKRAHAVQLPWWKIALAGIGAFGVGIFSIPLFFFFLFTLKYIGYLPDLNVAGFIWIGCIPLISGWIAEKIAPTKSTLPLLLLWCMSTASGVLTILLSPDMNANIGLKLLNSAINLIAPLSGAWVCHWFQEHRVNVNGRESNAKSA